MPTFDHSRQLVGDTATQARSEFATELIAGLSQDQKSIPSRFFYDARGSALFEDITGLEAYYLTRVEREILEQHSHAIAATLQPDVVFVEFGSGSSKKTEILLACLPELTSYMPIDVSKDALQEATARLRKKFPDLKIHPVVGDFTTTITLPEMTESTPRVGFFPGSTIGNFRPRAARNLLQSMAKTLGEKAQLIVGYDLKKSHAVMNRAYNDEDGVTAAFNLNVLARANSELGANFDLSTFSHYAAFDDKTGGVDMYLVSERVQTVNIQGRAFAFQQGERIHTEHSHKFSSEEFAEIAAKAGWSVAQTWSDPKRLMAVSRLTR